jgi:serine/threonine protein phosphatase PrpC
MQERNQVIRTASIFSEKQPGFGEDAVPLIVQFSDNAVTGIVFDGLGGAGSQPATSASGVTRSQAAWAAQILPKVYKGIICSKTNDDAKPQINQDTVSNCEKVNSFFCETESRPIDAELARNDLVLDLFRKFVYEDGITVPSTKLRSSLIRQFPSTIAGFHTVRSDAITTTTTVFWAGDSRVYVLDREGLHLVTKDHLSGVNDEISGDYTDSVMTNCFNLTDEFYIKNIEIQLSCDCIIIACTDGVFSYYDSPWKFEKMVLSSLFSSPNLKATVNNLYEMIIETAQDDATLCMALFGDFEHMRQPLMDRVRVLDEMSKDYDCIQNKLTEAQDIIEDYREKETYLKVCLAKERSRVLDVYRTKTVRVKHIS